MTNSAIHDLITAAKAINEVIARQHMSKAAGASINPLEPLAMEAGGLNMSDARNGPNAAVQLSIAISLKRLADAAALLISDCEEMPE